jgi:uncharacterized membrane protein HdeD (DUF308 family)
MHTYKKLGIGFILFGFLLIIAMYFIADSGAFLFTFLIGLMAIFFGAFQLMIMANAPATKAGTKTKGHKSRR